MHVQGLQDTDAGDIGNSLIERYQIGDMPVQLWATRRAFGAVTDPASISAEDAEDVTELQTGDTIDHESPISQIQSGDYSGCSPSTSSSRRTLPSVVFRDLRMTER